MRKIFSILVSFIGMISLIHGQGQPIGCGMTPEDLAALTQHLLKNKESWKEAPVEFRSVQYIPVKFHLVAKTDGTGRVNERLVLDQLCELNEDFAGANIQFYIKGGFKYLNNTTVFSDHYNTRNTIMSFTKDPGAINIWIVDNANTPQGLEGGVTEGYYSPSSDWLVIRKSSIGKGNNTLTHEMGHFFSLLHPFNGWDFDPYDPVKHGNPVNISFAPNVSLDGTNRRVPVELVNGSNCETSGDYLCDTPADYNFFNYSDNIRSCKYTQSVKDANGDLINPEERLFMNYFNCNINEYFFSPMQFNIIRQDAQSSRRGYLRSSANTPNASPIEELPQLISPVNGEGSNNPTGVNLEWTAVSGADSYLVEVDRVNSFSFQPTRLVTNSNSVSIDGLDAGRTYYWRITPFNETYTCAASSNAQSFFTGTTTSANELPFINEWSIVPNPVRSNSELTIHMNTQKNFQAEIGLFHINGQLVQSVGQVRFQNGTNDYRLPLNDLRSGVYILSLVTGEGRLNRRVLILD